jgi:hypothetical protein
MNPQESGDSENVNIVIPRQTQMPRVIVDDGEKIKAAFIARLSIIKQFVKVVETDRIQREKKPQNTKF